MVVVNLRVKQCAPAGLTGISDYFEYLKFNRVRG